MLHLPRSHWRFWLAAQPAVRRSHHRRRRAQRRCDRHPRQRRVQCRHRTAWRVLTDYNRYPRIHPGPARKPRRCASRGQRSRSSNPETPLSGCSGCPSTSRSRSTRAPPAGLQSRAVAGSLRALTSSYTLTPAAAGMRLDYVGHMAPGYPLFGVFEQTGGRAQRRPPVPGARRRNRTPIRSRRKSDPARAGAWRCSRSLPRC